jgi:hypothetical protein
MNFARRLQSHLNQVLLNQQKFLLRFDIEDFINIHRKIKRYLAALNEAFGFIFLMTFVAVYGSMVPQLYMNIVTVLQSSSGVSTILAIHILISIIWALHSYYHLGRFAFECDKMENEVKFSITYDFKYLSFDSHHRCPDFAKFYQTFVIRRSKTFFF